MDRPAACGVLTLTTDFGHKDPFVGVMKGRIYERFPAARIVDLTHEILAHWPAEAGFWLARSYHYFPVGTVHVAVVDPGVGTARDIAVVEAGGHVLLAPDNGLLAPVASRSPDAVVRRLDAARLGAFGLGRPSATFHGRDIFAPLAAELAAGRTTAAELGDVVEGLVPAWVEDPHRSGDAVNGQVILPVRRTYGDARPGEFLALVNSFDVLEIACAEGHAADALGLSRGAPVVVRDAVRQR